MNLQIQKNYCSCICWKLDVLPFGFLTSLNDLHCLQFQSTVTKPCAHKQWYLLAPALKWHCQLCVPNLVPNLAFEPF